jgi:hypothetical protein
MSIFFQSLKADSNPFRALIDISMVLSKMTQKHINLENNRIK